MPGQPSCCWSTRGCWAVATTAGSDSSGGETSTSVSRNVVASACALSRARADSASTGRHRSGWPSSGDIAVSCNASASDRDELLRSSAVRERDVTCEVYSSLLASVVATASGDGANWASVPANAARLDRTSGERLSPASTLALELEVV